MEMTSDDAPGMKRSGVRSFGIDDILGHTSANKRARGGLGDRGDGRQAGRIC